MGRLSEVRDRTPEGPGFICPRQALVDSLA
jgi:hypothetical protein